MPARSVSLHQVSHSSNTLPLSPSQWCSILLRWTIVYPKLLWVWLFEDEMRVVSLMRSIHSPYAKTQRGKKHHKNRIHTHVNILWSWMVELICANSLPKQEEWSFCFWYWRWATRWTWMFDRERRLLERWNTHTPPLSNQGKYLFLLLMLNCHLSHY